MSKDFTGDIDRYIKTCQEYDEDASLSDAERERLAAFLAAVDAHWPVLLSPQEEGFMLAWGYGASPMDNGGEFTPGHARSLDAAVAEISRLGGAVRFGQSTRGITYLNIDLPEDARAVEPE